jgi:hypothetical protein
MSDAEVRAIQEAFLSHLRFREEGHREYRIVDAHRKTFQWVLKPQDEVRDGKSCGFVEWLRSDDQIFWITGKPGSGKSTLVKYLAGRKGDDDLDTNNVDLDESDAEPDNEYQESTNIKTEEAVRPATRCHPYLTAWAGSQKLVTASFYFWNSGTILQSSQAGLYRSLLHQLISQRPELLPSLFPQEWETACLFGIHSLRVPEYQSPILRRDLRKLLLRVVRRLAKDFAICLFVDGLDEFKGDPADMVNLVRQLTKSAGPRLKICASSRPWTVFRDAFGREANLRMEDLTYDDIKSFVATEMPKNEAFRSLDKRYPGFSEVLTHNIVSKASGVFLWVQLVVKSLMEGISSGDRKEDLQRRLDELPPDLEQLYDKILLSLDPFYLEQASQYFQLMEQSGSTDPEWRSQMDIWTFMLADEETTDSALEQVYIKSDAEVASDSLLHRLEAMQRRIVTRCKGLLEADLSDTFAQNWKKLSSEDGDVTILNPAVEYLHRSVQDYIRSSESRKTVRLDEGGSFDPALQILIARLMYYKLSASARRGADNLGPDSRPEVFDDCLRHAAHVKSKNKRQALSLLSELKAVFELAEYRPDPDGRSRNSEIKAQAAPWFDPESNAGRPSYIIWPDSMAKALLECACEHYPSLGYVQQHVGAGGLATFRSCVYGPDGSSMSHHYRPCERCIIFEYPMLLIAMRCSYHASPDLDLIKALLERGADPNYRYPRAQPMETPWLAGLARAGGLHIDRFRMNSDEEFLQAKRRFRDSLLLMLRHGAKTSPVQRRMLDPESQALLFDLEQEIKQQNTVSAGWASWIHWRFLKSGSAA